MKASTLIVTCIVGALMWYVIIKWGAFMLEGFFSNF